MTSDEAYKFIQTEEFKQIEKEILESYNKTEDLFQNLRENYKLEKDYFWMIMGVSDPKVFPVYCPIVEEENMYE